jgi:hypothetical protein
MKHLIMFQLLPKVWGCDSFDTRLKPVAACSMPFVVREDLTEVETAIDCPKCRDMAGRFREIRAHEDEDEWIDTRTLYDKIMNPDQDETPYQRMLYGEFPVPLY